MDACERTAYVNRVGEWLSGLGMLLSRRVNDEAAQFQGATECSSLWNDDECRAFQEGAVLLTALIGKYDTWLPVMLYTKSARRSIRRMTELLSTVGDAAKVKPAVSSDQEGGHAARKDGGTSQPSPINVQSSAVSDQRPALTSQSSVIPARPNHIDQYVHLLPKGTQERAAKYGPLMRELDELREQERLLMDADGVSAKERETVAKRIAAVDKEVGSIKRELDAEWGKLAKSGRVVVDDLGMARVLSNEKLIMNNEDPQTSLTSEQRLRRRELRKWLTDTRRGNGDTREEHVIKWKEYFKEYLTLEPKEKALADQKIIEAMKHYDILEKRNL